MGLNASAAHIGANLFQNDVRTDRMLTKWLANDVEGVVDGMVVTPHADNHSAVVSAGRAVVVGGDVPASQGSYFAWSDGDDEIPLPPPQSQPFIATILLRTTDPQYGVVTGTVGARYDVISGTPASSPVAISDALINADYPVPGGWIRLEDIRINPADVGVIPSGQFTDKRVFAGVPNGHTGAYGAGFTGVQVVTATAWANMAAYLQSSLYTPKKLLCMVGYNGWLATFSDGVECRVGINLTGATVRLPGPSAGDPYPHGWGIVFRQVGDVYQSYASSYPVILNPGTTNFRLQAYKTGTAFNPQFNYGEHWVTPIRYVD